MTKGELRAQRKARQAAGQSWNVELNDNGQPEQVRPRTRSQERRHARAMDRWARRGGGDDFDYSMNG